MADPINMPQRPPMEPMRAPFGPIPGLEDEAAMTAAPTAIVEHKRFWTGKRAAGALLAVTSVLGIGAYEVLDSVHHKVDARGLTHPELAQQAKDAACPDGAFPNGPLESTDTSYRPNQELHTRPNAPLATVDSSNKPSGQALADYFFGGKSDNPNDVRGVVCKSAYSLAGLTAVYVDLLGAGQNGLSFQSTDPNELAAKYLTNKEAALIDAKILAQGFANSLPNTEEVKAPALYRIGAATTNDIKNPYKVVYIQEGVDFKPGDVFVTNYISGIGDGDPNKADQAQQIYTDVKTGQVWVTKAIGAQVINPSPDGQGASESQQNQESTDSQQQNGASGTFGNKKNSNKESNQPGDTPEEGGNGGFTPGTAPSFGPGPGETPTTGTTGGNTTTTKPNGGTTTTTAPPPSSTTTTTTSTTTTTTTTPPPTTKPGDPGQPGA